MRRWIPGLVAAVGVGLVAWVLALGDPPSLPGGAAEDARERADPGPTLVGRGAGSRAAPDPQAAALGSRLAGQPIDEQARILTETMMRVGDGSFPFDGTLARHLVGLLGDPRLGAHARGLLIAMGSRAAGLLWPLLEPGDDPAARADAVWVLGGWLARNERVPDPGWLRLVQDGDAKVGAAAWSVVLQGVPYDDALAAWCLARLRPGVPAEYTSPERALAVMGVQGVGALFAERDRRTDVDLTLHVLGALRFADPAAIAPFTDRLVGHLRAEGQEEPLAALAALQQWGGDPTSFLPDLEAAWARGSLEVQLGILGLLQHAQIRPEGATDLLLAAVSHTDARVSAGAVWLLGEMRARPAQVLPLLRERLDAQGGDAEGSALGGYGRAALPYLRSAMESGDDDVAYFAMLGLQRLGVDAVSLAPHVLSLLQAEELDLVKRAALTAGRIGAPDAAEGIWSRLEDETLKPVDVVLPFLALGAPAEVLLVAKLQADDRTANRLALEVLAGFTGRSAFALDAVEPYLRSSDKTWRRSAVQIVRGALGFELSTGGVAASSRDLLQRVQRMLAPLRDDPDRWIRDGVEMTLRQIEGALLRAS